jgi:hypothetical protein
MVLNFWSWSFWKGNARSSIDKGPLPTDQMLRFRFRLQMRWTKRTDKVTFIAISSRATYADKIGRKLLDFGLANYDPPVPRPACQKISVPAKRPRSQRKTQFLGRFNICRPSNWKERSGRTGRHLLCGGVLYEMATGRKHLRNIRQAGVCHFKDEPAPISQFSRFRL